MASRRSKRLRARSRGFTLLEVVIAVTIFAIVAIAVYTRSSDIFSQAEGLEKRTLGEWIAEDQLTRMKIVQSQSKEPMRIGRDTEVVRMAGREWRIETETQSTSDPNLTRVELQVFIDADSDELPWAHLTGFVGRY